METKTSMTTPPAGHPSGGNTQTTIDKQKNIYYTHKQNTKNINITQLITRTGWWKCRLSTPSVKSPGGSSREELSSNGKSLKSINKEQQRRAVKTFERTKNDVQRNKEQLSVDGVEVNEKWKSGWSALKWTKNGFCKMDEKWTSPWSA